MTSLAITPLPGRVGDALPAGPIAGVAEVAGFLRAIDRALPRADGIRHFNRLYLQVTEGVGGAMGDAEDPRYLERLVVFFADAYFDALRAGVHRPAEIPPAWRPLFEARLRKTVAPLQFAIAGMNAHINYDLPVGVVETGRVLDVAPRDDSPQHHDFLRVNELIATEQEKVKRWLLKGLLRRLDRTFGRLDDVVASFSIERARAAAWTHVKTMWELRDDAELTAAYRRTLSHSTGFAGRGLVVPSVFGVERWLERLRGGI